MKKVYLPLTFLVLTVLVLTSMKETKKEIPAFSPPVQDQLYLPEEPFDYDIVLPDYMVNLPTYYFPAIDQVIEIDDHQATLGRVLFYDKKLSGNNEVACASCHKQEFSFADNQAFSEGIDGVLTTRNTPNLNDWGWGPINGTTGTLFWDCRENNLEEMVLQPIIHAGEMGKDLEVLVEKLKNTEHYPPLFDAAFGSDEVTPERIGIALGQFVGSMNTVNSTYDQVRGTLDFPNTEWAGYLVFNSRCASCHDKDHLGTSTPKNNALDSVSIDEGLGAVTGNPEDIGFFRAPSLRNIAVTAPYMHDGRFQTLDEVLEFYNEGLQPHANASFYYGIVEDGGFHLSPQETLDLKRFLEFITDENFLTDPKYSNPFEPPLATSYLPLEEAVLIYPNPILDKATVQLESSIGLPYRLQLISVQGEVVKTMESNGGVVTMAKEGLAPGIYFLEIKKGVRKRVEKLVIQ